MTCVAFPRFLGPIPIDVVISENHIAALRITENPIEFGSDVADHAYVEPKRLRMHCVIAGGTPRVQASWDAIVALQETRQPFDIVTGLTLFDNMLIERVDAHRDAQTGKVLDFEVALKEVIIVESAYTEGQEGSQQGKSDSPGSEGGADPEPGETAQRASGETNRGNVTPRTEPTVEAGTGAVATPGPSTVEAQRNSSLLHGMLGLQ